MGEIIRQKNLSKTQEKSKISLAFGGKRIPRVIFHRKGGDGAVILDKNEKCVEIKHEIWYTGKKR